MARRSVRLLADDLTGALDTAAELVGITGPLPVYWHTGIPAMLPRSAAIDSGTRERSARDASGIVTALAPLIAGADIAYKKIDSLLRGPTIAELAACLRTGLWDHAVLSRPFPTRVGRCAVAASTPATRRAIGPRSPAIWSRP